MCPPKSASLAEILKQTKSFSSSQQEAYLSIIRTAAELSHTADRCLKPFKITQAQYNVLRILRGAGDAGLCRNEIRSRMLNAMPDMSRLLDRMEKTGWIERERGLHDRRQVATRLTRSGAQMLDSIDKPLNRLHLRQFRGMSPKNLKRLLASLAEIRECLIGIESN